MRKRTMMRAIARRLPYTTAHRVEEVLSVAAEVWTQQLINGETVDIPGLGRLSIDVQWVLPGGVVPNQTGRIRRVTGRFRPARTVRQQMEDNDAQ